MSKPLKQFTLEQFAAKTAILPNLVAETVLGREGIDYDADPGKWFVEHVELRTLHCYNRNGTFRKALNRADNYGRDSLYAFVKHWLDAFRKAPQVYMKRHPHANYQRGSE